MPSRTVKDRTTKVKVAGNLKGLSAEATNRSSPVQSSQGHDSLTDQDTLASWIPTPKLYMITCDNASCCNAMR